MRQTYPLRFLENYTVKQLGELQQQYMRDTCTSLMLDKLTHLNRQKLYWNWVGMTVGCWIMICEGQGKDQQKTEHDLYVMEDDLDTSITSR